MTTTLAILAVALLFVAFGRSMRVGTARSCRGCPDDDSARCRGCLLHGDVTHEDVEGES